MTKVIPFFLLIQHLLHPSLSLFFHVFFFSEITLFIVEPDVMLANGAKTFLPKGTATFIHQWTT